MKELQPEIQFLGNEQSFYFVRHTRNELFKASQCSVRRVPRLLFSLYVKSDAGGRRTSTDVGALPQSRIAAEIDATDLFRMTSRENECSRDDGRRRRPPRAALGCIVCCELV
ncbi:hypothetical protein EVAR_14346_1 [Eumeta japonica]|uniref:Uncharacterized protein n=1 Tax=Eumeta variegata TaxID=151549 RepID=A0A4C1TX33_EUMVA|nr:hypothetical protein EVAR_14346_1 [Eumeta japonica]